MDAQVEDADSQARDKSAEADLAPREADACRPRCLKLEVITTRAGFDALEADWNDLYRRAGVCHQLFQSFNWCWHWCEHFLARDGRGPQLAVVVARRRNRLVMVWPLVQERTRGFIRVEWLGDLVSQYGDVLVERGPEREALLEAGLAYIRSRLAPDVLVLRKVRADAAVAPLLRRIGAIVAERDAAPSADLARHASCTAFTETLSSKDRRSRRRHRRRLAEQGALETRILHEGPEAEAAVREALRLKRDWIARRALLSRAFTDPRTESFFAALAGERRRKVGCRIGVLTCDGGTAAMEIALRAGGRVASHIKVYAAEYESFGVGHLMTEDMVADIYREGAAVYDLLAPDAPYKRDWSDSVTEVLDWAVPVTFDGRAYAQLVLRIARPALKRLFERLPIEMRRRVLAYAGG